GMVGIGEVVESGSGVILLFVGLEGVQQAIGVGDAIAFGIALLIGGVLVYCSWLVITTGAFWIVRMENVLELFEGIYQTGRWPVTVYPGWLRNSVPLLLPIGFAVTVPAEGLTLRPPWAT